MSLKIGSTSIGSIYLGNTKIAEAYLGSTKVYSSDQPVVLPANTLRYRFTDTALNPTNLSLNSGWTWTQVQGSEYNDWDVYNPSTNWNYGPFADATTRRTNIGYYSVIAAGDTSSVTNWSYMFGTRGWNTANAFTASSICWLDTSGCTYAADMFCSCSRLTSLPPNMSFSNCTSMYYMFTYCTSLVSASIDCSSATDLRGMFNSCSNLSLLNLTLAHSASMDSMFRGCASLTSVSIDCSNATSLENTFDGCSNLVYANLVSTANATTLYRMFGDCASLTSIIGFNSSSAASLREVFSGCSSLVTAPTIALTNATTSLNELFYGCSSLTTVPVFTGGITWPTDTTFPMTRMLHGCRSLTNISNLSTISITCTGGGSISGVDLTALFANIQTPLFSITGNEFTGINAIKHIDYLFDQASLPSGYINVFSWPFMNTASLNYVFNGHSLTSIPTLPSITATTLGLQGLFQNNPDVSTGMLAAYNALSAIPGANGTDCFSGTGINTVQGMADRAQIPTSWGGDYVVQDYYLGTNWSKRYNSSTYGTTWTFTSNIDFSVLTSMQIYTEASISAYAGVNMRKSNIGSKKGSFSTSTACYYWPCIVQFDSNDVITWYIRTQNYNGMLTSSQSSGDMPGTLSINTLGNMSVSGGTFDPNGNVRFAFVVTNTADASDIIANHGILYNANFYADPVIRVVTSTLTPTSAYIGA